MRKNKKLAFIILIVVIAMSFIISYAGHFLLDNTEPDYDQGIKEDTDEKIKPQINTAPVIYRHLTESIKGLKQEINMLEVDLRTGKVEILPVLSHDRIFGFEKLSEMSSGSKAYAAINAGFFYEYGEPSGMVAVNGEIYTSSTGKYPVFITDGNKAYFEDLIVNLTLESQNVKLDIDGINAFTKQKGTIIYTPVFGTGNRAKTDNITVTIEDNIVTEIGRYKGETIIPENGMLMSIYPPFEYDIDKFPLNKGDIVHLKSQPAFGNTSQAYECGSWIVKSGKVVIDEWDEWIGVTTNRDPRTVLGLKDEYTIVLLTVDGRQPGYSAGLTGKELGELLLSYGVNDAAMLDGGASTEMIVDGKLVNRPSFKGQERPLAGGVIVRYK